MQSFCGSAFWDSDLSWNRRTNPDLTTCFQDTVMLWVPCGLLWTCAPLEFLAMAKSKSRRRPWTLLTITKLFFSLVLIATSLSELANCFTRLGRGAQLYPVDYAAPSIRLVTFGLTVSLIIGGRRAGFYTSAPLCLFWLLMSVGAVLRYRSIMIRVFGQENLDSEHKMRNLEFDFVVTVVYFPVVTCQFVMSCFADKSPRLRQKANASPETKASFISAIFFWWFNGMIFRGYKQPLRLGDMWSLDQANETRHIANNFDHFYRREKPSKKPTAAKSGAENTGLSSSSPEIGIMAPLFRTFLPELIVLGFHKLAGSLLTFVNPLALDLLIRFMDSDDPAWHGALFSCTMFFASMAESLFNSQYEYRIFLVSMRMRSAMINAIYRKALTLSSSAKGRFTTGEIVNLMAVDTQRIMEYIQVFNYLWTTPIQVALATYLLWQQLGVATLGGLFVMVSLLPINGWVTAYLRKYQFSIMEQKDRRIKLLNEMLAGIKVLKLYAWETAFQKRVQNLRNQELIYLKKQAYLNAAIVFSFACAPFLVALVSFGVYVTIDSENILDANKAFVSLTLFNTVRVPLGLLPLIVSNTAMFLVSRDRINDYLRSDDLDPTAVQTDANQEEAVKVQDASFAWSRGSPAMLKDITVSVPKGSLVAIVGSVGSGKSSLLSAFLGDMVKLKGSVTVSGSLAYSPQQAWIQNESVRNNILFGNNYDKDRYDQVIEACALKPDLAVLPAGDSTEVGEKGINVSGGQKQRISIARAVYSGRDVYLLDDPLSAVDSHVGKQIFDKVIGPKGMLRDKTRVLVTHRLSVLPEVDTVVVMRNGRVSDCGSFQELLSRGGAFSEFLTQFIKESEQNEEGLSEEDVELFSAIASQASLSSPELVRYRSARSETSDVDSSAPEDVYVSGSGPRRRQFSRRSSGRESSGAAGSSVARGKEPLHDRASKAKLTEEETAQEGSVKWGVYWDFVKAMGTWMTMFTLLTFVISHVFNIAGSIWLGLWSNDALDPELATDPAQKNYRLGMYAMYGTVETVFVLCGGVWLNLAMLRGSRVVHDRMLHRVLRAPMAFFDTTPMGRILNRFSKDVDAADVTLPFNARMLLVQFMRTVVAFVLIALQTPLFLTAVLPLLLIYYYIQKVYIATSRQLKRLESVSRSPIYVHFSETVTGSSSIRAYGVGKRFVDHSDELTDINHSTYFPSIVASRWLATRLEFIGYTIVLIAGLLAVNSRDTLSPGMAGLSVSYALTVTLTMNMLVRSTSDTETNLVSVERCLEYTKVTQEAPWENPYFKPDPSWPVTGEVEFQNYSTRYRADLDLVLKGITCDIKPGEKVGIVGRTGAGKSSLTLALFRIIEAAGGAINIDGLDISTLGLYDLRRKLTIIPQDPVLFSGTLRSNLDPFDVKGEEELWRALEHSHLKDYVASLSEGLQHEIAEGGENISVGQRQLVCLARALLRKSRILILDEATAAVDMETDDLIQATIRREFADCTIITIAHRLNTILDYDRVIVLDSGEIAESDSPRELMKRESSIFYAMAKDANLLQAPQQD
ncbi:multidrug resistance-associated protein 1 [Rhipicephalus sanguineus]|uniref:multidrug resistance-associated protein 1 n=1 Tax=Rhipicephalus sanguineus TaxID=34632 RepID=UPI001895DA6F|nr:multidrug resistance-associated protein 1 [Rhipicephalus sanguineus]